MYQYAMETFVCVDFWVFDSSQNTEIILFASFCGFFIWKGDFFKKNDMIDSYYSDIIRWEYVNILYWYLKHCFSPQLLYVNLSLQLRTLRAHLRYTFRQIICLFISLD